MFIILHKKRTAKEHCADRKMQTFKEELKETKKSQKTYYFFLLNNLRQAVKHLVAGRNNQFLDLVGLLILPADLDVGLVVFAVVRLRKDLKQFQNNQNHKIVPNVTNSRQNLNINKGAPEHVPT